METTFDRPQPFSIAKLLFLFVVIVVAVILGGRAFEQVVVTNHFYDNSHACDNPAKAAAINPSVFWKWNYECRDVDGTVYRVEAKTPLGVVVLIVCVCSTGGLITLKLITGYRKNGRGGIEHG